MTAPASLLAMALLALVGATPVLARTAAAAVAIDPSSAAYAAKLTRAESAAAKGKPAAMAFLGYAYVNGLGVPVDVARGLALTRRAAAAGDARAQANMGLYLANGHLLPRNYAQAADYYQRAAAQGSPLALRGLGNFHQFGRVYPRDIAKAIDFYKRAVAAGDGRAAFQLGMIYGDNPSNAKDADPDDWFRAAVRNGYAPAANFIRPAPFDFGNHGAWPPPPPPNLPPEYPDAPRLALVIGNAAYGPELPVLRNPVKDATLIAQTLEKAGFKVTPIFDSDQNTMKKALSDFGAAVAAAGESVTALVYYSGHGAQSQGVNYLIPVKAPIRSEADLDLYAVSTDSLLRQLQAAKATTNIVILDSCRNAPFPSRSRGITAGLARMDGPIGSYIAYATAPGDTASDGDGDNSPYTLALSEAMLMPGVEIEEVFKSVRNEVRQTTNGDQTPWESSSLLTRFRFLYQQPATAGASASRTRNLALRN